MDELRPEQDEEDVARGRGRRPSRSRPSSIGSRPTRHEVEEEAGAVVEPDVERLEPSPRSRRADDDSPGRRGRGRGRAGARRGAPPLRPAAQFRAEGSRRSRSPRRSARRSGRRSSSGSRSARRRSRPRTSRTTVRPSSSTSSREPLEPGLVVSGEIRDPEALGDALKRFFDLHKLPKNAVRLGVSNNRIGVRTFEIEGDLRPAAARERDSLPGRGGAPDPARPGGARLRRPRGAQGGGRHRVAAHPARRRVSRRRRPVPAGVSARRPRRSSASTTRRSRCCARFEPPTDREVTRPARSSVSRSATTGRRSPCRPGVTASSRASSTGAAGRSTSPSRASSIAHRREVESIKRQLSFAGRP